MKRFFGMMPSSEIELSKRFVDSNGLHITVDAGKNGWTIMYANNSSPEYKDVEDTAENNLNAAITQLKSQLYVKECCGGKNCESNGCCGCK